MTATDTDRRITRIRVSNVIPSPQFPRYLYLTLTEALRLQAALTECLAAPEKYRGRPPSDAYTAEINVQRFGIPQGYYGPVALRSRVSEEQVTLVMRHVFPDVSPTSKEERLATLFPYLKMPVRARKGLIRMMPSSCWDGVRNGMLSVTYADVLAQGRARLFEMRNVGVTTRKVFDDIMEGQGLLDDWLATGED